MVLCDFVTSTLQSLLQQPVSLYFWNFTEFTIVQLRQLKTRFRPIDGMHHKQFYLKISRLRLFLAMVVEFHFSYFRPLKRLNFIELYEVSHPGVGHGSQVYTISELDTQRIILRVIPVRNSAENSVCLLTHWKWRLEIFINFVLYDQR